MKLALTVASVVLAGSLAMAADAENAASTTVDTSKNPITGITTTKKVTKKKVETPNGDKAAAKVTETTKVTKDGKTTVETEVKAEATEKKH